MRKFTVVMLTVGCLALLAGTMTVQARLQGVGDISFQACDGAGTYDEDNCTNDKVRYCHFNEGGDGAGRAHCGNESSYAAHVGPGIVVGHSQKDFCITSAEEEALCVAGKTPDDPK